MPGLFFIFEDKTLLNMTILEAVKARHSVRKYTDLPVEPEKIAALQGCIATCNEEGRLHIQLVTDEAKAFASGVWKYGSFSGVRNYLVMAAEKGRDAEERIGFYGEKIVLLAQTLGLNTCWVGLTYKKIPDTFMLAAGETVHCVIALGYGRDQGVQHPLRPVEKFYEVEAAGTQVPGWFLAGVEAALFAPTAVNQQKFKFIFHSDASVEARALLSLMGYTHIDLGIAKCHFELAAGTGNFQWRQSGKSETQ